MELDPFLLLDEFRSDASNDYIAGFPDHPHRGFETVTYLKAGKFRHRDSKGHEGLLTAGSVQWMTAGRGIIHSEMPEIEDGLMWGYQLWVNLPAESKMTEPRYQDILPEQIPLVEEPGLRIKVIAGTYTGVEGPAKIWLPIIYFDVELETGAVLKQPMSKSMNGLAYVYDGSLVNDQGDESAVASAGQLMVFGAGDQVEIATGADGAKFLLIAGTRLDEPIVRGGPFVMNTDEQLHQAFIDYQNGVLDR
jgi:redox-sensitive bicupin YhaK (pirin superfamily)